ncbi:hypothetical protein OAP52_05140 [Hellea sp.]|nr:hypothetical protein [Hellea sp.]MDB4845348.1 hypothetical protein [Hellea sp.]MDC0651428.1 hypothetical protein [Hellea sp.]
MKASNNHFLNKYSGLKPTLVFRSNTYFLVNSTQPYTGLQKGYHSNKQLKYSFCYEDGKLCGTELYDRNGQLREKANYINGRLHGEYEKYDGNGQLREKANYINGLLYGEYEKYDGNGQLRKKANYIDGYKQFSVKNTFFLVAFLITAATFLTVIVLAISLG